MQQERLNKILGQKLDKLKTLPKNVAFDSPAAWGKLEEKLNPCLKGRRENKFVFKWIAVAAACTGIIAAAWILISDNKGEVLAKNVTIQQGANKKKQVPVGIPKDDGMTVTHIKKFPKTSAVSRNNQLPIKQQTQQENVLETTTKVIQQPIVATLSRIEEELQILPNETTPTIYSNRFLTVKPQIVIASAPVKKFRIVHNNETMQYQPETFKTNTASNSGFPFFKNSFASEESNVETSYEEATAQPRKKERVLLKTITTSIKD